MASHESLSNGATQSHTVCHHTCRQKSFSVPNLPKTLPWVHPPLPPSLLQHSTKDEDVEQTTTVIMILMIPPNQKVESPMSPARVRQSPLRKGRHPTLSPFRLRIRYLVYRPNHPNYPSSHGMDKSSVRYTQTGSGARPPPTCSTQSSNSTILRPPRTSLLPQTRSVISCDPNEAATCRGSRH